MVAEMTGRQFRMVRDEGGLVRLEKRSANNLAELDDQNNYERAQFNEGKKRIAIISDASSAGISLHANRIHATNTRRRCRL
ncbi:unnamed protein product, partial [Sphacelaria rigidula]